MDKGQRAGVGEMTELVLLQTQTLIREASLGVTPHCFFCVTHGFTHSSGQDAILSVTLGLN